MVPTLDEVRHIRGFGVAIDKAVKGSAALDLDWEKLEAFRDQLLSTIRDHQLRAFIADVLAQRIERHPLREFSPDQARLLVGLQLRHRWPRHPQPRPRCP